MENPLLELQEYENLLEALKKAKGPLQAAGTLESQKVHLMHELGEDGGFPWKLVVTYDEQRAKEIYDDFRSFTRQVWLYPAKDLLFYSADIHGNLLTRQRLLTLRHLMEDPSGVVVTTLDGLMDHLFPLEQLRNQVLRAEPGQELDLEQWKEKLTQLGLPINLAISLHAAEPELRTELMPVNKGFPFQDVIQAAEAYVGYTGRQVTYEYILIAGKNDSPVAAELLANHLRFKHASVNLIPANPVPEKGFERPSKKVVEAFLKVLQKHKINATVRREMGKDIDAACGQLRARFAQEQQD